MSSKNRIIDNDLGWRRLMSLGEALKAEKEGASYLGLGPIYETPIKEEKKPAAAGDVAYQTIHNVWMYFLFKGGIIGILLTILGLGGILATKATEPGQLITLLAVLPPTMLLCFKVTPH